MVTDCIEEDISNTELYQTPFNSLRTDISHCVMFLHKDSTNKYFIIIIVPCSSHTFTASITTFTSHSKVPFSHSQPIKFKFTLYENHRKIMPGLGYLATQYYQIWTLTTLLFQEYTENKFFNIFSKNNKR